MDDTSIERLSAALQAAIRRHKAGLAEELARQATGFERRFLLARLAVPSADLDLVAAADDADALPQAVRAAIAQKLADEEARLLRLARVGSPAYDVNRHIAVRRTALWSEGKGAPHAPAEPAERLPGNLLNRRFRRRRPARRRPCDPMGPAPNRQP